MRSRYRLRHQLHRLLLKSVARLEPFIGGPTTTLLGLGALVGVTTGAIAVVFVLLIRLLGSLAWSHRLAFEHGSPGELLAHVDLPSWYPVVVVPMGLLLVAWLVRTLCPDAAGHGVPEVMYAVAERAGRIKSRVGWVKMLASSVTIGLGGSVGKEGPIVQVGSAFGSALGQFFKVKRSDLTTLVGCGSAAGIAAAFNAPIGGVMFALELIIGGYHVASFAPVVIASVVGAVTARRFLGTEPAFDIPEALRQGLTIVTPWEFGAYVVLGVGMGVLCVVFTRVLYAVEDGFERWRSPFWVHALLGGAVVGVLAMAWPEVLGESHETMTALLFSDEMSMPWTLLLTLGAVKALATVTTLGAGGSGGVFMPSLFFGAMAGGAFGQGMEALFGASVAPWGAYALAGMAAGLAGTAHAPLTGILLLFEMSDNYLLILPLMTTSILATAVSRGLLPDSIYTLKLSRRGIVVGERRDTALLRRLRVSDAMQPPMETVPESAPFSDIVNHLLQSGQHDFPVVDNQGHLMGALSLNDLREFLRDEHLHQILTARDCVRPIARLAPQSSLLEAFEAFDKGDAYEVPVVSRGRLVGSLRRHDILTTYRRALLASTTSSRRPPVRVR